MAKTKPSAPQKPSVPERPELPAAGLSFFERPGWRAGLLLLGAVVVVYAASLSNGFVFFDDDKAILYNRTLENPSLGKFFSGQNLGMYAPLTWIGYWVGSWISGQEAWGYHLLALALHALNAMLAFRLLQALTGRFWPAFTAALLFAVHPMQVEAVSWAAALSTVLFSTFYLGSLLAWVRGMRSPTLLIWPAISLILFVLACLSKSAAVTLPLVLSALVFLFSKEQSGKFWLRTIPFYAVALVFGLYTFATRAQEGHDIAASSAAFSLVDRFFMICQTVLFYPFKLLLPLGYEISYPFVKAGGSWPWTYYAAPVVLAVLIFFFFYKKWWQNRELALGLALYFLPLTVMLPFRTVGSFELRSDRYVYISCLGLFLLGGFLLEKIRSKEVRLAILLVFGGGLAFLASRQTAVWKDGVSLFENCKSCDENMSQSGAVWKVNLAYNELIKERENPQDKKRDFADAAKHYTEALEIDPNMVEAYNGRGQAYLQLNKIPEALEDFNKAIQAGISTPKLFLNRGKCLALLNRPDEAIPDLTKSLALEPASAEAYLYRGRCLVVLNRPAEAIPDLTKSLELAAASSEVSLFRPDEAYFFRAAAREKTGDPQAEADYSAAIQENPNSVQALVNRGFFRYKARRYDEAIADYSAAQQIAVQSLQPMILSNRAAAQLAAGRPEQALADANKALEINPNYKRAYENRAGAYQALGQPERMKADLEKAAHLQ